MTLLLQYTVTGIMVGSVYALIALGIVVIYKSSSVFNFAHGDFMLAGGLLSLSMLTMGIHPALSVTIAVILGMAFGILIERGLITPLIGQPVLAAVMMTLGLSVFMKGLIGMIWGFSFIPFPSLLPQTMVRLGDIRIASDQMTAFIICAVLFSAFAVFFWRTKLGLAMRATAEDNPLTESLGINVKNILAIVWGIAFAIAVIAGILMSSVSGGVGLTTADLALKAFPAVIVGGLESIVGAAVGGLIVGICEFVGGGLLDPLVPAGGTQDIIPYVVLLIILLIRPYGFFGQKKIERI